MIVFYQLCPRQSKIVPLTMQSSRQFSFISAKKYPFIVAGAVELWVMRSVIQAPVVNAQHCPSGAANP
jgi:hypothetical protein